MTDNTTNYDDWAQTVARLAAKYKKPNKANAFKSLASVIERVSENPDVIDDGGQLLKDLADLYAFFLPPAPAKPKTAWDWVAKAMGVSDVRHYLNWVYVTADHVTATDGYRMHRAPNVDNLAPGFYDKAGQRCHGVEYATYPEVERIIPRALGPVQDMDTDNPTPVSGGNKHYTPAEYTLAEGTTVRVSLPYVRDALSMGAAEVARVSDGPNHCARFDFEDGRLAVVMGMRK